MKSCPESPRYVLIGYPGKHDTIVAKSLLKKANIDFVFIKETEEETSLYCVKRFPAIRLIEAPSMAIADGINEIKSWLKAS
jgi:hypothetical protein